MVSKPDFTIVAGANGAGKSTLKNEYLRPGTLYFDGDFIFLRLQQQYPNLSKESLGGGVAVSLERTVKEMLEAKKDFAFETNFSSNMAIDLTQKFRENGFNANLLYIGIDSLELSKQRVADRVLTGGHNVDNNVVEFNYKEGIKNINENLSLFDNITFVNNKNLGNSEVVAIYRNEIKAKEILSNDVEWFNRDFKNSFQRLNFQNLQSQNRGLKI